jgi:hypothetical protein
MASSPGSDDDANGSTADTIDELAGEIASAVHQARGGKTMEEHVAGAAEMLGDDDLIAFSLVCIREVEDDDGTTRLQGGSQRAIDPEAVRHAPGDPEQTVDDLHSAMVEVFEAEIADRE